MNKLIKWSAVSIISCVLSVSSGLSHALDYETGLPVLDANGKRLADYFIPRDTDILKEPNAEQILYGKQLLNDTKRMLPDNVGAAMNCNSCHVSQGKVNLGAPFINTVNAFPQINPRMERMMWLEERINGCFFRSMNGKPLDKDGPDMKAIIAFMTWLAQGVPHGAQVQHMAGAGSIDTSLVGDPVNGKAIYAKQCASCHGDNGQGLKDQFGGVIFPPLWGDESFNIGAGMARTYKAAAFVKYNMPMGINKNKPWGQGGLLTDQEAVDVSEFFTHMPRPDFEKKGGDWPSGKKPKDARY